jgi:ADP-ribosyl-[dinitrogen reductase] hydrolase
MSPLLIDRYSGCPLGLACVAAVGTTLEFRSRDSFAPLTDMIGGGPFCLTNVFTTLYSRVAHLPHGKSA